MTQDHQNQRPRERNQVVPAIWISTSFVGENDALIKFFAQTAGLISVKAKGLKKATSKLSPHLQTADELLVSLTQGRGVNPVLTGVKLHKGHQCWRDNLNHSALAWLMGECAVLTSTEEDENTKAYQLVVNLFRSEPDSSQLHSCASAFFLKFLQLHGLFGSLNHCAISGETIVDGEPVHLLLNGEGLVGRNSYNQHYAGRSSAVVRLAPGRITRWRNILGGSLLEYKQITADEADVALLIHLASARLEDATGRQVGSAKFLVKQWNLPDVHDLGRQDVV